MDRERLSALAHTRHPIAAPLSDVSVARLIEMLDLPPFGRLLDVGCGGGEWLVRTMAAQRGIRGDGVDLSEAALHAAEVATDRAGLAEQTRLFRSDAAAFAPDGHYDVILCVGSAHALGGRAGALGRMRDWLADGGVVMLGDGFWEQPPTVEALARLGAEPSEYDDLATTVESIEAAGWRVTYAHVSTAEEWDDYEWSWTGTLEHWALQAAGEEAAAARAAAAQHRDEWLRGYRGVLGFVTLLLRPG